MWLRKVEKSNSMFVVSINKLIAQGRTSRAEKKQPADEKKRKCVLNWHKENSSFVHLYLTF